uniref:(California timema) hypothetical protein n=1 Tax=Timema californicum TaxID=61474 RepID=A0A7R9J3J6_TIMCA|nr:unnamed protein product [Timema californicum]
MQYEGLFIIEISLLTEHFSVQGDESSKRCRTLRKGRSKYRMLSTGADTCREVETVCPPGTGCCQQGADTCREVETMCPPGTGCSNRGRRVILMCKKTPPVHDQSASEYTNDGGPQILAATGSAVRGLVASVGVTMGGGGGGDHTVQASPNEQRTQRKYLQTVSHDVVACGTLGPNTDASPMLQYHSRTHCERVSETVVPQSMSRESDPSVKCSREITGEVPETWVHHDAAVPPEVAFYRIRTRRRGFRAGSTKKRRGKRRQPKTAGPISEDESVDDISEVMSNHAEIKTRGKTILTEEADDPGRDTVNEEETFHTSIKPIVSEERIIETQQTINKGNELEEPESKDDNLNLAEGENQAKTSDNTVQNHCKTQENKQMLNFNEEDVEMTVNDSSLKNLAIGEIIPDIYDHSRGRAKRGESIMTQKNTMPQNMSTKLQDFDTPLKDNVGDTTKVPLYRFKGRRHKCCVSTTKNRRGKRHSLNGSLFESGNNTVDDTDGVVSNHKLKVCKEDKHDIPTLKEEVKREDNKTYQEWISRENAPESEKVCDERRETNSYYIKANCMSEERQQINLMRENEISCTAQQNNILLGPPRQGVVQIAQSAKLTKQLLFGTKGKSISSSKVTTIKKVNETTPRKIKQCGESIRDANSCTSNFVELECEYRRTSLSNRMSFLTLEFTTPRYFSERSKKHAKGYNPFREAMLICRGRVKFPRVSFGMDLIAEEVCCKSQRKSDTPLCEPAWWDTDVSGLITETEMGANSNMA